MNMNKLSTSLFMQGSHGCIHAEPAHIVFLLSMDSSVSSHFSEENYPDSADSNFKHWKIVGKLYVGLSLLFTVSVQGTNVVEISSKWD